MTTLAKIHKEEILKMIDQNEPVRSIKSYCKGANINTNSYSSPIHISDNGKLTMRYRGINTYYYIKL